MLPQGHRVRETCALRGLRTNRCSVSFPSNANWVGDVAVSPNSRLSSGIEMNPDLGNPVIFTVLNIFVWLDDEVLCSAGNVYISKIFIEPSAFRFRPKLESPYSNI
jgi:hypothetical protein